MPILHERLSGMLQREGASARTEVAAIEEWERVQAEAALAKEQEEAILVSTLGCPDLARLGIMHLCMGAAGACCLMCP